MNIVQINAIRASINLAPLEVKKSAKNNQAKNLAMRAQASRELKAKRTGKGK